ncbi:MAG: glutaredoxin family protein [Betaproteobacteria bacterium]|nr:glutaredoxin family protein [Betaproteobacteria bacterium]
MKSSMIVALLGIAATAHAAQFYEWVDEKGVKQYTQQPPPANVKQVQQRRLGTNVIETSGPAYSLQQAVKNFPVTLYVTDCGEVCKTARAHLAKRGIPFSEKNPQKPEEMETFKKLTGGGMEVPLLVVGQLKTLKGYLASDWDAALDAAGYPSTAVPGAKPTATPPAK